MQKLILSFMMVAILAFSCKNEEEATLSLSKNTLEIKNAEATESVTVTTNQPQWVASSGAEWVVITQKATSVDLAIKANPNSGKRQADVIVNAGPISKKITVIQDGSKLEFEFYPKSLDAEVRSKEYSIKVNTNSTNWTVKCNEKWVKAKKFGNEISISLEDNPDKGSRKADIVVTDVDSKTNQTFSITQNGLIILPCLVPSEKIGNVRAFEEARGSSLMIDIQLLYNNASNTYNTPNSLFPKIVYGFTETYKLENITVFASSGSILKDPKFLEIITKNGYVKKKDDLYTSEGITGANGKKYNATLKIVIDEKKASGYIIEFVPVQTESYKTFDAVPYGLGKFEKTPITKADIDKYEAQNHGKYNETESDPERGFYLYSVSDPKYAFISRLYFMEKKGVDKLSQTGNFFSNFSYCFFEVDGAYYFTKEWQELMNKEGFNNFVGITEAGFKIYDNSAKKLRMFIKVDKYMEVNGGKPTLDLRFSPMPPADPPKTGIIESFVERKTKTAYNIITKAN